MTQFILQASSHPSADSWTTVRVGVESLRGRVRVSVVDGRLTRTALIVSDLLHHHLLVVRSPLWVGAHTRGTAGVAVAAEGGGPVGAWGMPRGRVAGWRGGVLWGHHLSGLVGGHHLSVCHHGHLRGHGSEPLAWGSFRESCCWWASLGYQQMMTLGSCMGHGCCPEGGERGKKRLSCMFTEWAHLLFVFCRLTELLATLHLPWSPPRVLGSPVQSPRSHLQTFSCHSLQLPQGLVDQVGADRSG